MFREFHPPQRYLFGPGPSNVHPRILHLLFDIRGLDARSFHRGTMALRSDAPALHRFFFVRPLNGLAFSSSVRRIGVPLLYACDARADR